jgi:uncharacterized protein (TIGR00369 family)
LTDGARQDEAESGFHTQEDPVTLSPERQRTYSWSDPAELAAAAGDRDGMQFLLDIGTGRLPLPPIMATLGVASMEVEHGRIVFTLTPAEWHYNPIGSVHGGVALTLLDSAMGCAVHTLLEAGVGYTTLEVKTNFVRPITADTGLIRCEGIVIHRGARIATAEGKLTDSSGKLLAHGTTTCLLFQ